MFKFLKSTLSEKEQELFDVTVKPYAIYSIINVIFMGLASHDVGILNEDVFGGLFISWIIYSLTFLITTFGK